MTNLLKAPYPGLSPSCWLNPGPISTALPLELPTSARAGSCERMENPGHPSPAKDWSMRSFCKDTCDRIMVAHGDDDVSWSCTEGVRHIIICVDGDLSSWNSTTAMPSLESIDQLFVLLVLENKTYNFCSFSLLTCKGKWTQAELISWPSDVKKCYWPCTICQALGIQRYNRLNCYLKDFVVLLEWNLTTQQPSMSREYCKY